MVFMLEKIGLDKDRAAYALMEFREIRQGFRGSIRPS
jgi:hypothetical protein